MNSILNSIFEELPEELGSTRKTRSYILREAKARPRDEEADELVDERNCPGELDGETEGETEDESLSDHSALDLLVELFDESLDRSEAPFDNYCGGLFDEVGEDDVADADTISPDKVGADESPSSSVFENWDLLENKYFEIVDESESSISPIARLELFTYGLGELKASHLSASTSSIFVTSAKGDIARYNLKLIAELINEHLGKRFVDARISHYVDFGCSLFSTVEIERFFTGGDPSLLKLHLSELSAEIVKISDFIRGLSEIADFLELALPNDMPLKEKIRHD